MPSARSYSLVERALHHLAFSTPVVQKMLGELENDLYRKRLATAGSSREVFVTGLPRAGTTLLLELLYGTGEFRTFTYRDMPFILAPLLWQDLSKRFRKQATTQERAHGDGMEVSFDSPEAFEEIIWLAYLRDRIEQSRVLSPLSRADCTEEFVAAFRATVTKLLLQAEDAQVGAPGIRYLSKNNANLSRIEAIAEIFPSSTMLVPFRSPPAHVASMKRLHERFLKWHDEDAFSRRYMNWLGHFDFGENLKPIDFGGWLAGREVPSPVDEEFWMQYWTAAYSHVLNHRRSRLFLVDFDALLQEGRACLERIAACVGIARPERLIEAAATLREPTTEPVSEGSCSRETWNAAREVHEELQRLAV